MFQTDRFRNSGLAALALALLIAGGCGGSSGGSGDEPGETPTTVDLKSGLDQRPVNEGCIAPPKPAANPDIQLVRVFSSLSFDKPLAMLQAPGEPDRWFVVEKDGRVWAFENSPDAQTKTLFWT